MPSDITDEDFRRFAKFLGERVMVRDYALATSQCIYYLTSTSVNWGLFSPTKAWFKGSTIIIYRNGNVSAYLSKRDAFWLGKSSKCEINRDAWEKTAANLFSRAFACFHQGDPERAHRVLMESVNVESLKKRKWWTLLFLKTVAIALSVVVVILIAKKFLAW